VKTTDLVFEKVGDISATYPYLCVYVERDAAEPFMEIAVTDERQLLYTIYAGVKNISLSAEDWSLIEKKAFEFLPKVLADEGSEPFSPE